MGWWCFSPSFNKFHSCCDLWAMSTVNYHILHPSSFLTQLALKWINTTSILTGCLDFSWLCPAPCPWKQMMLFWTSLRLHLNATPSQGEQASNSKVGQMWEQYLSQNDLPPYISSEVKSISIFNNFEDEMTLKYTEELSMHRCLTEGKSNLTISPCAQNAPTPAIPLRSRWHTVSLGLPVCPLQICTAKQTWYSGTQLTVLAFFYPWKRQKLQLAEGRSGLRSWYGLGL